MNYNYYSNPNTIIYPNPYYYYYQNTNYPNPFTQSQNYSNNSTSDSQEQIIDNDYNKFNDIKLFSIKNYY